MKLCPVCGPDIGSIKKQYGKEYCCNTEKHHGTYCGLSEYMIGVDLSNSEDETTYIETGKNKE